MVSESGNVDVVLIVYMVFSATCLRCIMNNNNNNNSPKKNLVFEKMVEMADF